ncbi:MAG: recombinase family protein [Candidatus Thiodiazotropha endolucinida]
MGFETFWECQIEKNRKQLNTIREAMEHLVSLGFGQIKIAEHMNDQGITTVNGTRWSQPKVSQYLKRLGLKTKFVTK